MSDKDDSIFLKLIETIERLRGKDGCPWDRAQDMDSMRKNIIEEAEEVVEAIEDNNPDHVREELGDLLFLTLFITSIAKDKKWFNYRDVVEDSIKKLIFRHPHVFGDKKAYTKEDALVIWKKQKEAENKIKKPKKLSFDSIMIRLKELLPELQNLNIDIIIGIKRGGLVPSAILAYKLNLPLYFIELRLYEDKYMPKKMYDSPKLIEDLSPEIVKGKRILLVDDINNTGQTIDMAKEILYKHEVAHIYTFSIIGKNVDYYLFLKESCVRLPWL